MTIPINLKRVLILSDSLGLPRNEGKDLLKYHNTWPSLLNCNNQKFEFINYSLRSRTIIYTKKQFQEIKLIEPSVIIFQIGVVDCAPRIFSLNDQKWLRRLPNFLKHYVINFRKKRRAKLQTENPLSKVYVKPHIFQKTYFNLINDLKQEFEDLKVLIIPIIGDKNTLDIKSTGFNHNISLYNTILHEVANDSNSTILDLFEINSKSNFCSDGYHVNETGNKIIFEKVNAFLND